MTCSLVTEPGNTNVWIERHASRQSRNRNVHPKTQVLKPNLGHPPRSHCERGIWEIETRGRPLPEYRIGSIRRFEIGAELMKTVHILLLALLLALVTASAQAQASDPISTLPVSMQAQVGITTETKCSGNTSIPFTPVFGSSTQLKCGDWVTIIGAHGDLYIVRTENNSTGYVPATAFPTDPCAQTNFRIRWFNRQWMPKFKSMSQDEAERFIDELYLKATPEDISVAYHCVNEAMDREETVGGVNGYLANFDLTQQSQTYNSDEKNKMMGFTTTLNDEASALEFIERITAAQLASSDQTYEELVSRYNRLVDKYSDLVEFAGQKVRELNNVSQSAAQPQTSTWRRAVAGTLQGIASYTPPKHIVCRTNANVSLFGDATQPDYIYMNGSLTSHTECQEQ